MKPLRPSQPHAIILVGIPGSGKSDFAGKFSANFNIPHLKLDFFLASTKDLYESHNLLNAMIIEVAKTKSSIVLETDTYSRVARNEIAKRMTKLGYKPLFVWSQVDAATARQRALKSKRYTNELFDEFVAKFSPPHTAEKPLVISGKHTHSSQARIVLKRLSAGAQTDAAPISTHKVRPTRGNIIIR